MEQIIKVIPEQTEMTVNVEAEPFLLTETQDKTVELDMSSGDQVVRPDGTRLLQSVTIEKPDTLIPENILEDVNIGGVVGSVHIPEEQSKTVELDFSESDTQEVTPDSGKMLDSVTINKPDALIPENIKKNVNVAGVTGEYETVLPPLNNPATDDKVINGYEYYTDAGERGTGSYVPTVIPPLSNPAIPSDVTAGKDYINGQGEKETGTKQDVNSIFNLYTKTLQNGWYQVDSFPTNKIILDVPYAQNLVGAFSLAFFQPNTTVEINAPSATNFHQLFYQGSNAENNLKKVKLSYNPALVTTMTAVFQGCVQLEEIDCDFDLSFVTSAVSARFLFNYCSNLKEIRFVPNSLPIFQTSMFNACTSLSDASIVYIGNALMDGVTSQTLSLPTNIKARTLEIMGTVSQVTDNGVTYNFFTAEPEGSITLNYFITTIKGWTLA